MAVHLLIVDDESTIRKGLSSYMPWHELGCVVDNAARDGAEAIEQIKSRPPDIVITDIKMPRVNGIEVARFVREHCPKTKVIILSGHADFEYARSALVYGVSDYVVKPVAKEVLLATVKKLAGEIEKERMKSSSWPCEQLFRELAENNKNQEALLHKIAESGLVLSNYAVVIFDSVNQASQMNDIRKNLASRRPDDYFFIAHNGSLRNSLFWVTYAEENDIQANCCEIVAVSRSLYAHTLSIGISLRHMGLNELSAAFKEAQESLLHNFYSGGTVSFFPEEKSKNCHVADAMYEEAVFFITQNISIRAFDVARSAVSALFMDFRNSFAPEIFVRDLCKQIYFVCYGVLRKSDLIFLLPDFLSDIAAAQTADELKTVLLHMI
ncbi:MAG: response regulator, partial [Clostridiales bacterium]|nr:response regulator [Clostridiales bacterium]